MKRSLFGAVATSSAAATTTTAFSPTIMSHRTSFRGDRGWGRGRKSYSDSSVGEGDYQPQFVTGDSHFRQVQDSNRGFRPPNSSRGNYYNPRPAQPPSGRPYGAPPPRQSQQQHQPTYQNQQSFWSPSPRYDTNQQFRPHLRQQLKPRPPKELEFRNWEYAKPEPPLEFERFIILSYNILADYLASEHRQKLYFHLPSYMMDWEWRKRSIVFELGLWSADILCLQEVDRFQDLKEALELRGYSGIWKMRTGDPVDGCAVFWRNSRFKLLREESIEFNKLGLRDNVAQICVFESLYWCNDSEAAAPVQSSIKANKVVVCNIHVLFNPRRGEIKLGQIRVLLGRAHAVSKLWDDAPIIVCGDFNSTPKSPLYNFIADQKLNLSELPRDQVSGQASAEIQPPRPSCPETGAQPTGSQVLPAANLQKQDNDDKTSGNGNYEGTLSESFSPAMQEAVQSCLTTKYANEEVNKELRENDLEDFDGCIGENGSAIDACHGESEDNAGALPGEAASSGSPVKAVIDYSCSLDVKMETLSLTEVLGDKKEGEDENTCLSASSSEVDESFKECTSLDSQGLYTFGSELLNNIPAVDPDIIDMEKPKYDSSAWTPGEIEAATGSLDCTMMEHPLKLRSVYTEVEDLLGTRDSTGEPSITSYHRRFFGTVDYIWRSEGLQTSMVLAPIPKHAMKWTRGFPTKKWGSDHIALVSELAFRNHISNAC